MHPKNFALRALAAAVVITASVVPAFAEPSLSSAPAAQPASVIAPPITSRLGYALTPILGAPRSTDPRSTDPRAPLTLAPAAEIVAPKAPAPTKVVAQIETPKSNNSADKSGPSAADLKLLAQLDAELNATEKGLDKANAQLSSGQKQLVRVAGVLQSEMLQGGVDSRGLHPFVRVAERYAGTPYVWGGESARGFDCSGFIIRVMRDLGYKALPHSAAEQFRYGIPVAKQNLRPGDLVFFANTYKPGISHVGIYLGRGRFIHAASTLKGTITSSLTGSYAAKYAGARRLVRAGN